MIALPAPAHALIEATLRGARLSARDRAVVRAELEAHFLDGLDAGVQLDELVRSYGDPCLAGSLIARAKRRSRAGVGTWLMGASAAAAIIYSTAVLRLATAPAPVVGVSLDREAETVLQHVWRAQGLLVRADGVLGSFAIAAELRARHSLWAEIESLLLLERTFRAGDSLLAPNDRVALSDSLAALNDREALSLRRVVIDATRPQLVDRLYGRNGRVDRAGLRLVLRTKGVERPTAKAVLVEPLYFAPRLSRAEVQRMVDEAIGRRSRDVEAAATALTARLHSPLSTPRASR